MLRAGLIFHQSGLLAINFNYRLRCFDALCHKSFFSLVLQFLAGPRRSAQPGPGALDLLEEIEGALDLLEQIEVALDLPNVEVKFRFQKSVTLPLRYSFPIGKL